MRDFSLCIVGSFNVPYALSECYSVSFLGPRHNSEAGRNEEAVATIETQKRQALTPDEKPPKWNALVSGMGDVECVTLRVRVRVGSKFA